MKYGGVQRSGLKHNEIQILFSLQRLSIPAAERKEAQPHHGPNNDVFPIGSFCLAASCQAVLHGSVEWKGCSIRWGLVGGALCGRQSLVGSLQAEVKVDS